MQGRDLFLLFQNLVFGVQRYNKMLIYLHFIPEYYLRMSVIGGKVEAFGARIRIKCANVGAI